MAPLRSEHDLFLMLAYFSTHSLEGLLDSFSQGFEKFHPVSSSVLQGIELRLKDFHQLLLHPPKVWGFSSLGPSSSGPIPAHWVQAQESRGWPGAAMTLSANEGGSGTGIQGGGFLCLGK